MTHNFNQFTPYPKTKKEVNRYWLTPLIGLLGRPVFWHAPEKQLHITHLTSTQQPTTPSLRVENTLQANEDYSPYCFCLPDRTTSITLKINDKKYFSQSVPAWRDYCFSGLARPHEPVVSRFVRQLKKSKKIDGLLMDIGQNALEAE